MLTLAEAAQALGLTPPAVNDRFRAGKLIALEAGARGRRYPAWQFEDEIVGAPLEAVLAVLKGTELLDDLPLLHDPGQRPGGRDAARGAQARRYRGGIDRQPGCLRAESRAGIDGEPQPAATACPPRPHRSSARRRRPGRVAAPVPARQIPDPFPDREEGADGYRFDAPRCGVRCDVLRVLSGSVLCRDVASDACLRAARGSADPDRRERAAL